MDRTEALQRIIYLAARLRDIYPDTAATLGAVTRELHTLRRDAQSAYAPDPDYLAGVAERAHMLREACEGLTREWCELADLLSKHAPGACLTAPLTNAHNADNHDWAKSRDELNRAIRIAGAEMQRLVRREAEAPTTTPGDAPTTGDAAPALSPRQYAVLQAMLEAGATDAERRCTTAEIAAKAEGSAADPQSFKRDIAALRKRGLVHTKHGAQGGCWLTPEGCRIAAILARR